MSHLPDTAEDRPASASPPPPDPEPGRSLEDFLGGRVLGWAGAVTVLLGIVLLVAVAIGRGWIDEPVRIGLAFAASAGMLTVGAWLYERRGGTQAALLLTGSGLAALYVTLTAGIQLYHLYAAPLALLEAAFIGLVGTVLAVRWSSRVVASLSIGGALLAPYLVDAGTSDFVIGFVLITLASAVGVLTLRSWNWLAVGCFFLAAPQLLLWVGHGTGPLELAVAMAAYAFVNAGAALGYELRVRSEELRPSSTLLVLCGGLVTAAGGYYGLRLDGYGSLAEWWVAAVGAAHLVAGVWALRSPRVGDAIALVTLGSGMVLADIAFGTIADGPVVAAGWAASAAALALVARRRRRDVEPTRLALGGQLTLALGHVLLFDASPLALISGVDGLSAPLVGIASVGIACFVVARLDGTDEQIAILYDSLAIVALAYGTAYALDGPALVAAWAGTGAALAGTIRRDRLGPAAAGGFVALASLHAIALEAPPDSLGAGVSDLAGAVTALAAVAGACVAISRRFGRPDDRRLRIGLQACAAVTLLYLASVAVVTVFQPGAEAVDTGFALGARAQGQVLLSCLWASAGALALVIGLSRDRIEMRIAGFGLLALSFCKVLVFDLAMLDSIYRVASCVALGLLMLGSAFAYQRMRPRTRAR